MNGLRQLFSDVGESARQRWERELAGIRGTANQLAEAAPDFYNGFSRLPYRVAGSFVDAADTVTRPLAGLAGVQMPEPSQTYGTSDWMIAQAQEAGLLPPSSGSTAEMAGDVLGGLLDVSPVTEAAMVSRAMRGPRAEIFAGQKAATADLAAMRRSEERLASGDDPAKVWAEEGWFRGPDGQMRFEIDDSASMFRGTGGADSAYAANAMQHPELFAAYPDAEQVMIQRIHGKGGSFSGELGDYGYPKIELGYDLGTRTHGASLHEMQHGIQAREGFALGGDPSTAYGVGLKGREAQYHWARRAYEDANGLNGGISDDELLAELTGQVAKPRSVKPWDELTDRERTEWLRPGREMAYRRLAGEAEARAVEDRMRLSAAERRARYPLEDYDVPLEELIIRR